MILTDSSLTNGLGLILHVFVETKLLLTLSCSYSCSVWLSLSLYLKHSLTIWNCCFRMLLIALVAYGYLTSSIGSRVIPSMGNPCFSTIWDQSLQILLRKRMLWAVADVSLISSWSTVRCVNSTLTSSIICDVHIRYFIMLDRFR